MHVGHCAYPQSEFASRRQGTLLARFMLQLQRMEKIVTQKNSCGQMAAVLPGSDYPSGDIGVGDLTLPAEMVTQALTVRGCLARQS